MYYDGSKATLTTLVTNVLTFWQKKGANGTEPVQDMPLVSAKLLRNRLKEACDKAWQKYWDEEQPCRQTKLFIPTISKKLAKLALNCNRKDFSVYIQMVTGHNGLNYHNTLIDLGYPDEFSASCIECGEIESSLHVITDCVMYVDARLQTLLEIRPDPPFYYAPATVIDFVRSAGIDCFDDILY